MAERTRKNAWHVELSDEEDRIALEKMKAAGTDNKSLYARKMLCDGMIINIDYSAYREVAREVNRVGVNINQIAKRVNETTNIYENDISEILEGMRMIWQQLRKLGLEQMKEKD